MSPMRMHLAYKNIRRLRTIVAIFVKHGFYPLLESLRLTRFLPFGERIGGRKRSYDRQTTPLATRIRLAFEELGPTFIKFGQLLSTRSDIVPEGFVEELLKLQDEVPPVPFAEASRVIESEFDAALHSIFSEVDDIPVAAASIAQVYRAVTLSHEEVMVKVQRPGIEDVVGTDIAILRYIVKLLVRYVPESRVHDPAGVVEEFARVIKKEMDFTLEASHMERFAKNFSEDRRVVIPGVFWDLTSKRVLTMDRIEGIKIDNVAALREKGIDTTEVAKLLSDVFFRQVFEYGAFHGDLHPGNIFVIDASTIGFMDFGIVGMIDTHMQNNLADILIGLVKEDFEGLTRVYLRMGVIPEDIDEAAFRREHWDLMLHYFGRPLKYVRVGEFLFDYIQLAARYNIRLQRDLLLFDKCLLQLESLTRLLHPGMNIMAESEPYAAALIKQRLSPGRVANDAVASLGEYHDLLRDMPGQTTRIMRKIEDDRLAIGFVHKGLEEFIGEMDRSSNRLTFGLIVAAIIIGSSLVMASEAGPILFGYPALGVAGFFVATLLGLWLAFMILKSGKY